MLLQIEIPTWLQDILFDLWVPALSGFAALLGGFCGAYLKEKFTDSFSKKKRLREIRYQMNRNLFLFFQHLKKYALAGNQGDLLKKQIADAKQSIKILNKPQEHLLEETLKWTQENQKLLYNTLLEINADLVAHTYECEYYISKTRHEKLEKTINDATGESDSDNLRKEIQSEFDLDAKTLENNVNLQTAYAKYTKAVNRLLR